MSEIVYVVPTDRWAIQTHTYTPFYQVIGSPGDRIINRPGILVPPDLVTTKREGRATKQGVSFSRLRDAGWRLVTGLHPYDSSKAGGYTPCIRLDNGYWVPHQGLHDLSLAHNLQGDDIIPSADLWHELFGFNCDRLAWLAADHLEAHLHGWRLGAQYGWISLTFDNELWYMHSSIAALRQLMSLIYTSSSDWHIEFSARAKSAEIYVPDEDLSCWQEAEQGRLTDMLARDLHLNSVTIGIRT